jgi:hypothetical protein
MSLWHAFVYGRPIRIRASDLHQDYGHYVSFHRTNAVGGTYL